MWGFCNSYVSETSYSVNMTLVVHNKLQLASLDEPLVHLWQFPMKTPNHPVAMQYANKSDEITARRWLPFEITDIPWYVTEYNIGRVILRPIANCGNSLIETVIKNCQKLYAYFHYSEIGIMKHKRMSDENRWQQNSFQNWLGVFCVYLIFMFQILL